MTNFLLGFHCHQPVGNFESVLKEVHSKSYSPLIRTLLKHGSCKFCLHISGYLLEWIVKNDPELIKLIREGAAQNKVEMLGGGYYEPILASIPLSDRMKQLEMLNKAIKKYFGVYPKGAWITERIWQPDIIESLNEAGMNYAFLDDFQFFQSGVDSDNIDKIFLTEYNGKYLNLFPIHERLRYKIPFAEPDESISEVLHINGRLSNLSVMVDDGEKMGGWPDTYEWVYGRKFEDSEQHREYSGGNGNYGENGRKSSNGNGSGGNENADYSGSNNNNGWLYKFLTNISSPSSNIKMKLPSELIGEISSRQLVYLPMSSYREMGEWTLPVEKRFKYIYTKEKYPDAALAGGIWHNFFIHYPESNLLHKRMLYLSSKINSLKIKFPEIENLSDYKNLKIELFKSQANDAYWHGVFGGIYLPHLRRAIQNSLIKASVYYDLLVDKLMRAHGDNYNNFTYNNYIGNDGKNYNNNNNNNNNKNKINIFDFDADGELEYQIRNQFWQAVYKPSVSQLIALDYVAKGMANPFGDIFCLHDEYDLHIIKDELNIQNNPEENKKTEENEAQVPHTIHDNMKIPAGLTSKDLVTKNGLMPHFQMLCNGSDLNFNLKSIENNDGVFVIKSEGFLREDKESSEEINVDKSGVEKGINENNVAFRESVKNKILLNLEITISDTVQYHIAINNNYSSNYSNNDKNNSSNYSNNDKNNSSNYSNNDKNNSNKNEKYLLKDLSVFFRFSFSGGDGPATYIKPDDKNIYGLREELINIPVDSPIELGDSYWGGKLKAFVSTNGYANYKANKDNVINIDFTPLLNYSPITTLSLYEGGYEKIFQASELNILWDMGKSIISDINIEWKVEKNKLN